MNNFTFTSDVFDIEFSRRLFDNINQEVINKNFILINGVSPPMTDIAITKQTIVDLYPKLLLIEDNFLGEFLALDLNQFFLSEFHAIVSRYGFLNILLFNTETTLTDIKTILKPNKGGFQHKIAKQQLEQLAIRVYTVDTEHACFVISCRGVA